MRSLPLILAALFCSVALSTPEEASAGPGFTTKSKEKQKKKKGKKKKGKKKKGKKKKKKGGHDDDDDTGSDDDDNNSDDDDNGGDDDDDNGGDDDDDTSGGGAPDCNGPLPNNVSARIKGAGIRSSFTVGGELKIYNGSPVGKFIVTLAPRPPSGDTFLVHCNYNQFDDVSITASGARFSMHGRCLRMFDTGRREWFDVDNAVQIANNVDGDAMGMSIVGGGSGIAIPGGALSAGDFVVTLPE